MIVLAVVMSVVLLQFHWFGDAASEQAEPIDTLLDVMIVLSCFVFSIVMVMLGYAIWKFRASPVTSPTASRSTATPSSRSPGP